MLDFGMALAANTDIPYGLMGVGYRANEVGVASRNITIRPNVADAMVSSGLIQTQAYSLWLNDPRRF
jgi:Eukaryotic aspartyl protease